MTMTLKDKLLEIKKELIVLDRDKIFEDGVNIKLLRSENNYKNSVENNCDYILSRNNYKAIMAMDRYNRWKEKKINEEKNKYGFIKVIKP